MVSDYPQCQDEACLWWMGAIEHHLPCAFVLKAGDEARRRSLSLALLGDCVALAA